MFMASEIFNGFFVVDSIVSRVLRWGFFLHFTFYSCAEWLPVAQRVEAELHLLVAQFVSHQSIL